jgi:hypothetical protein
MFNPNDPAQLAQPQPGQFGFEARQAAIEQRKKLLAVLMRRQEQLGAEAGPDGRMVGRTYVNPHPLEHLAHAIKPLMAQWGAAQEQRRIQADTEALSKADREAAMAHVASRPTTRDVEVPGPQPEEMEGVPVTKRVEPTTQDRLKWAQEGMHIPSRRDVLSKVIADLEVNEPIRQEARADRQANREDRQAESRAAQEANLQLRREQLEQAASAARQRSEDTRASIDQRREAAQMHAGLMRELAQMRADAKAGDAAKGKTLPQSALKDIGALEETAGRIGRLQSEFDPRFAGLKGAAATIAGNNIPGVTTDASEWWKNYRKEAELVERHAMFGASLTEGEKQAWRDADIAPKMAPDAIQRNLARRKELADKVFANAVERQQRAGYNARDVFGAQEPTPKRQGAGGAGGSWDDAPVRVNSKAERDRLPKGTRYVDPQGNVATR